MELNFWLHCYLGLFVGFLLTFFTTKNLIVFLKKTQIKQNVRDDIPKNHIKKNHTPTSGGIAITIVTIVLFLIFENKFNLTSFVIIFITISFSLIGFLDDFLKVYKKSPYGLLAYQKFLLQIISSVITVFILTFLNKNNLNIFFITSLKLPYILIAIFWILVLVGGSNAINLTDGLDGLATSNVIAVSCGMLLYSILVFKNYNISIFLVILIGSSLAFLWHNSFPAKIFMGDTGSLFLGSALSVVAILLKIELVFFVMGLIFVIETLSVVLQVSSYKIRKKRIFKMSPIHHHFELSGWHESKIVNRFLIITFLLVIIGLIPILKIKYF